MTYGKLAIWAGLTAMAAGVLIGCKEKPQAEPNNPGQQHNSTPAGDSNPAAQVQTTEPQRSAETTTAEPSASVSTRPAISQPAKPTLREIIARRQGWKPAYVNWYGRQAPDFTVTDISGKRHRLSEYKGRNIMLVFWATWCIPCIKEIPHLIELRNTIGEDKLAMLAIAQIGPGNTTEKVKNFVAKNTIINYTVISVDAMAMPSPYNYIYSIPCAFFIDPEGRIKLATEGLIPLSQIKAIIEADR
jgi:thiol-disulfide isomerase/thioredoxin